MTFESYRKKLMGCWLGKAVGGTLGMPYEGEAGPLDLSYYDPVPRSMVPNDDLDLQVVWACLLDRQEQPRVDQNLFIEAWKKHIHFPWDEYGVCRRNLLMGVMPPLTGSYDNWFQNSMGAAIRSEIWACLAPGDPGLAAAYAREDACLDHAGQGLWAEVWLATLQSMAFVQDDIHSIIEVGFEYIPEDSEIRIAIESTYHWWQHSRDWRKVRRQILDAYGHENFTNVTENLAFVLLGLLDGNGDFSRSICTANNCGKDTDCTAATVGAILGILNPDGIDQKWLEPIGRNLVLSNDIKDIEPPETLDAFCDMIIGLRGRLRTSNVLPAVSSELPMGVGISARIGSADVPWFGHGWEFNQPLLLERPKMKSVVFEGTWGRWPTSKIDRGALFLEFSFHLQRQSYVRIVFNTAENCRVFVDDNFGFGREEGRMAPSPHRIPMGQGMDCFLAPGDHSIVAVIKTPDAEKEVEWVVGVADRENNDHWIPGVFLSPKCEELTRI